METKFFELQDPDMNAIKGGKTVVDTCPTGNSSHCDVVEVYEDGSWDTIHCE